MDLDGWLPNLSKQTSTAWECTEGATLSSSDFFKVRIKQAKSFVLLEWTKFLLRPVFSGFWWGFLWIFYLPFQDIVQFVDVAQTLLQSYSKKHKHFLLLEFISVLLGSVFSGVWWGFFKCLDTVLLLKISHSLLEYISTKWELFVSIEFPKYFATVSFFSGF